MAKSTTVVRDEKQSPERAVTKAKAADKLAERGQDTSPNQLTGMFTRTVDFLRDVRSEMRKVTTPSREEVRTTTTGGFVTVFAFAAYFYVVDAVLSRVIQSLLHWLGGVQEVLKEKLEKPMTEETNPETPPLNPEEGLTPSANERFKWSIIHAYSGFERKVKESIEGRVQAFGLQNRIGRVMIPTEPVTEVFNGKKRTVERVFLPGYVLVEMDLDNDLWHVMKNTPRVTGFLGTGDKPVALSEQEVSSILFRTDVSKDKPRMKIKFEKNESVRITDGPFANFNGVVDEVNEDRETLKVMVTIFGRSTPVELEFGKVEKVV